MRSSETEGRDDVDPAGPTPRDDIRPLSRARKTAFIAITLLGSTAIWVVLAELAFRIFDIGPEINPIWHGNFRLSRNPVLRYELEPGSKDGGSNINSHGMRDREYTLAKPAGSFRIAVIGDSIAYGFLLPERWSFSAQLEELLNNHYRSGDEPAIEVLNFGVTGYSFTQVMETLRSRALAFDPDLVIYAYSLNDPQEYSLPMANLLAQLTNAEERYLALDGPSSFAQRWRLYRLARYVLSRETPERRERPVWNRDDPQFVALRKGRFAEYYAELNTADETWQPIASGLLDLEALSASRGVPVHAIIFPELTDLDEYPIPEVHTHLAQAFSERSIRVLDLLDHYTCYVKVHRKKIAADMLHPNKIGHGLTAVVLLHHLLATDSLPGLSAEDFSRVLSGSDAEVNYARLTLEVERKHSGQDSQCGPR